MHDSVQTVNETPEIHRDQLQRKLIKTIGLVAAAITGFYSFYDFFVNHLVTLVILNGTSTILFLGVSLFSGRAQSATKIGTLFILALLWVEFYLYRFNPAEEVSFVWLAVMIPMFFILKGHRKGLLFSVLYSLTFSLLYFPILTVNGFANLICSLIALIIVSYYYEIGWFRTEKRLVSAMDELRKKSIVDELTDIYNRRYFNEIFSRELQKNRRETEFLAFFMVDVDNFKEYNDLYGHHNGDLALTQIGHLLKDHLRRAGDYPFRLGGEEFGGVIHANQFEEVLPFVDSIRQAVENLNIEHIKSHNGTHLTVSIGLKIVPKTEQIPAEELYQMSDSLLYKAKSEGRNRTCAE